MEGMADKATGRLINMEYPDYSAEIEAIERDGITVELVERIIRRHQGCAVHMKSLYGRYQTKTEDIPVFNRIPRFTDEQEAKSINNKINNDFFSEIVDIKVGFFAGKPANYTYGDDYQSEEETGGEDAVEEAAKALSDFVKRNNLFDVDMETTKFASICGYAGRLFYVDREKNERVMVLPPYETIILSNTEITEPKYGVRYYEFLDLNDQKSYKVEFYDERDIYYFSGHLNALSYRGRKLHLFDYCPLQGVPNNRELMGDAEKVLALIDDYDSNYSDNSNDIEGFANAYMVFKNCRVNEHTMETANATGVISIEPDAEESLYDVTYLTKDIDATFVNSHLDRAQENIYRFSKTPNLNDPEFTAASGMALRIKMTGLETKTGAFEAKQVSAATYMFKLLASSFAKKKIPFDPLQCNVKFNRNFPVDFLGEAQAAQALIAAGLPKEIAFKALSFVDDIGAVMRLIEEEQENISDLDEGDDEDEGAEDVQNQKDKEESDDDEDETVKKDGKNVGRKKRIEDG